MFLNYMKIAFRNIFKQKTYSFINILGLAIGISVSLLIFLWVMDELSYDKFHKNSDTIYQVYEKQHYSDQRVFSVTATPYPLAPALKEEFPEIIRSTRLDYYTGTNTKFKVGDNEFTEDILIVDRDFLEMTSFKFLHGNLDNSFNNPNEIIITESISEKYFEDKNPVGKVMKVDGQFDFIVSAVLEDVPHNSSIQFEILGNVSFLESINLNKLEVWGGNSTNTFIQLDKNANVDEVSQKIRDRVKEYQSTIGTELFLHPLNKIHLYNIDGASSPGRIQNVIIFSIIAIFIIIIASINFINLSTARATKRLKEVGLKKVIGATRIQLARQFFGESVLLTFLSLILAIIFVLLLLPDFNFITNKEIVIGYLSANFYLLVFIVTLFVGLVAGLYPSLYLSKFQPIEILNERGKGKASSTLLRTILVVFQFTISVVLILATIVTYKQTNYLMEKELGFSNKDILFLKVDSEMRDKIDLVKNNLSSLSSVKSVSSGLHLPSLISWNGGGWVWEGKPDETDPLVSVTYGDNNWWKVFDIKILNGRGFDEQRDNPESNKIMINQTFAKMIDPQESVVGKTLTNGTTSYNIIGVVDDFNFLNMRRETGPLVIYNSPNNQYLFVKLNNTDTRNAIDQINNTLSASLSGSVPSITFFEDHLNERFVSEKQERTLAGYFALLTIIIASLGLVGLSSFIAEQKTREIGIRKILGAAVSSIISSMSLNFIKWIVIANLIGLPLGYYLMNKWLENYPYRTEISWELLLLVFLTSIVIALISTGFQSIKASLVNPVKSLRYE